MGTHDPSCEGRKRKKHRHQPIVLGSQTAFTMQMMVGKAAAVPPTVTILNNFLTLKMNGAKQKEVRSRTLIPVAKAMGDRTYFPIAGRPRKNQQTHDEQIRYGGAGLMFAWRSCWCPVETLSDFQFILTRILR
jgi:hypothetical protein